MRLARVLGVIVPRRKAGPDELDLLQQDDGDTPCGEGDTKDLDDRHCRVRPLQAANPARRCGYAAKGAIS